MHLNRLTGRGIIGLVVLTICLTGAVRLSGQGAAVERPKITGISHVGYFVSDLPKALGFWHDLLGYDEAYFLTVPGTDKVRIAFIKINNDHQHIELFTDPPTNPPNR